MARVKLTAPKNNYDVSDIYIIYFFIFISICFYSFVNQELVADYDNYLLLIDQLYHFPETTALYFEPLSTLVMYASRVISNSSESAILISRIFITIFLVFSIFVFRKYDHVSAIGVVACIAIYGPLLGFVTIRATPAYMLVTLAALDALKGRRRSLLWALIAIQFHISAALAVLPLVGILIQSRTRWLNFFENSTKGVIILGGSVAVFLLASQTFLSSSLSEFLGQISFLSKYLTYVSSLDATNGGSTAASSGSQGLYHQIYLVIASILAVFIFISKEPECRKFRFFVAISFITFLSLQISPVTAFRYSIFWIIPCLIIYPWEKFTLNSFIRLFIITVGLIIFLFQMRIIIE